MTAELSMNYPSRHFSWILNFFLKLLLLYEGRSLRTVYYLPGINRTIGATRTVRESGVFFR